MRQRAAWKSIAFGVNFGLRPGSGRTYPKRRISTATGSEALRVPFAGPLLRALPVLLALVLLFPGVAQGADATKKEVDDYATRITERQNALGETLVLLGRVIEITLVNRRVVGTGPFWDAVDKIDAFIEEKAGEDALEEILTGLEGKDIREVHGMFILSIRSLKKADAMVRRADYQFSPQAQEAWDESRLSFLSFTDELKALMAKHGLEP
jgi:hypothetical protein